MYRVVYDTATGLRQYCVQPMTFAVATKMLALLSGRYLNNDGTPKAFPNGKGFYDVRNPRIVPA